MAKIGVNIGEDFPVDEGKPRETSGEGPERCPGGEDWREHREEWKRRWREHAKARGYGGRYWRNSPFTGPSLWRAVFIIGGIALLIAIISHFFYFILGAAVLAVLYAIHHNHHDALWDMHPHGPAPSSETK